MNYFTTKSKTLAYALQYVTNQNFYKFTKDNQVIYSFIKNEDFLKKLELLNNLKFNIE